VCDDLFVFGDKQPTLDDSLWHIKDITLMAEASMATLAIIGISSLEESFSSQQESSFRIYFTSNRSTSACTHSLN